MTESNLQRRRELRQHMAKRGKLDEITNIMDAHNITVQDIQNYLEAIKQETSTFDEIYSRRQQRRADEKRRKALRLANEKRRKQSSGNSKKKTSG